MCIRTIVPNMRPAMLTPRYSPWFNYCVVVMGDVVGLDTAAGRYFDWSSPAYRTQLDYAQRLPWRVSTLRRLTIDNNRHAGSDGCAPTPSQYLALAESNFTSLKDFPSPSAGGFGIGSYVPRSLSTLSIQEYHRPLLSNAPRTSIGLLLRAVLEGC